MQKSGHFANACPETCTVQGGNPSKLPGVSSFSMHVVTNVECLQELADTTESLDQLALGSCELMIESFMIEQSDDKCCRMGDPLARRVEHVLAMSAPFPEDNTSLADTYRHNRFTVYWVNKQQHIICNSVRLKDRLEGTLIWSYLLENRVFHLGDWYSKFISCHCLESKWTSCERWLTKGNALALCVEEILMDEFDPGWCGSGWLHRFDCHTHDVGKSIEYYTHDRELVIATELPAPLLLQESSI